MVTNSSFNPQDESQQILPILTHYIEASRKQFKACIDKITHPVQVDYPRTDVDLYYVKFDPTNGQPKFGTLAEVLAKHVVRYSLSVRTREQIKKNITDPDEGDLLFKAREYFRKIQGSGEVGELLLFFLLEAALEAPQIVCKMELKTNPLDELKGSDGIHIKWDEQNDHLDVYLGESKLYQKISNAIDSVFKSITTFYDSCQLDDEINLVTSHFKYLDDNLKDTVTSFINKELPEGECHIIHACLIGWDWSKYMQLVTDKYNTFFQTFNRQYKLYVPTIEEMLNARFHRFKYKHLTFRFFFLPFKSVGDFRRAFYKKLCGVDIGQQDNNKV